MRLSLAAWTLCLGTALTGCVSVDGVSKPASFPASPQYKLKSVAHWKLIAQDVAAQTAVSLRRRSSTNTPLYLRMPEQATPFERNFLPMLRSALLENGLKVTNQSEGAAELQIQVDRIAHAPAYRAGTLTLLGGGLLVLRDIVTHDSTYLTNAGGALAAIAADVAMTRHRPPPELELVLSVHVRHGNEYRVSQDHVYYLSSEDRYVYENPPVTAPTGRVFEVQGAAR